MNFGLEIPKIENEDVFENLCLDLIKADNEYENANRYGRRGQRQNGVDILARNKSKQEWLGIQCKVKQNGSISINEIQNEIQRAYNLNPRLAKYIFYTTAKRDVNVQDFIREKSIENINNGLFDIDIKFWEDISEDLKSEKCKSVHYKYYRNYYTQVKNDGFAFGKLVTLNIGDSGMKDSYYPVLIGKTFSEDGICDESIEYWKDAYFIVNFHERRMEMFPIPCYPTDIKAAFENNRDRYIITKILNSIPDMEKFLESDEKSIDYVLDRRELNDFLAIYSEE
ncbi:restriction endonuclease [Bacillus pretiosus]|uniref:restriction endonuclease n=1 Tax=Bacillus pretiosus TaxID=2983392 RepID=UPI003D65C25E